MLLLSKGDMVFSGLTSKCLPLFNLLGEGPEPGTSPLDFLIDLRCAEIGEDENRDAVGKGFRDLSKLGKTEELHMLLSC